MEFSEMITQANLAQRIAFRLYAAADRYDLEGQWKMAENCEEYADKAARRAAFYFSLAQKKQARKFN